MTKDAKLKYTILMSQIMSEEIQDIAVGAGAIVLANGGETYRAEETVVHIAQSLGAKEANAFITPTVVIFSYTDETGEKHTYMRRIFKRGTNLRKIAQINDLSRRLERRGKTSNPKQVMALLQKIEKSPSYPNWLVVLMAALSSSCFTMMFGGKILEAVFAFVIGLILRITLILLEKTQLNSFIISLLSGAIISILADMVGLSQLKVDTSIIMIGTLMQVVPGLALVNSIRDIIGGDLVSGTARLMDALMIAAGLSIGSVAGVLVTRII